MSKKRTGYSSEFNIKLGLEILKNEKLLAQIASENNVLIRNLQKWKKQFLENAEIAMEPAKAVSKEQIKDLEKKSG